jgi:hypothetical protein
VAQSNPLANSLPTSVPYRPRLVVKLRGVTMECPERAPLDSSCHGMAANIRSRRWTPLVRSTQVAPPIARDSKLEKRLLKFRAHRLGGRPRTPGAGIRDNAVRLGGAPLAAPRGVRDVSGSCKQLPSRRFNLSIFLLCRWLAFRLLLLGRTIDEFEVGHRG